jgi:hypothetical protein
VGVVRNAYNIFVGKPEVRDHSEDIGVNGQIILDWMLGKHSGKVWTGRIWLSKGTVAGSFEHGKEPSDSV